MTIRPVSEKDYRELILLYNAFVGSDRYSKFDNDSFQKVIKSENNFVYVAEDKGKLVGFAAFSVRFVIRYPKPIAELDELFVSAEYRRHGLGKQLMDTVMQKAAALGCYRLFIESHYKHTGAHKFYEALGFANYGYHFIKNL
jgi:GNAT superfamily N-acetyltransferase